MNVHPIFVHFPIALLTLYALLELARFRTLQRIRSLQTSKLFLLFAGTLAAIPTVVAGKLAQWSLHVPAQSHTADVIRTHSYFALSTLVLFLLLSCAYASRLYLDAHPLKTQAGRPRTALHTLAALTDITPLVMLLAFVGVTLIFVTGTLGGIIVYGPDLDPVTHFVNTLIFGS